MNRLVTETNGGMPDVWDAHRWYFDAVKEAFSMIGKSLGNGQDAVILWGATWTESLNTIDVAEGAIYMNAEVFHIPAHSISKLSASGFYYWRVDVSYDPTGDFSFENNQLVSTFEVRQVLLDKSTQAIPGHVPLATPRVSDVFTLKSLYDSLLANHNALNTAFNQVAAVSGASYYDLDDPGGGALGSFEAVPWDVKAGRLIGSSDLLLNSGGIYMVNVVQGGTSSNLRLNKGGSGNQSLPDGITIVRNETTTAIQAVFERDTDADIEVYVIMVGVWDFAAGNNSSPPMGPA